MISDDQLFTILTKGRHDSYVIKSISYNPYVKSEIYDWHFEMELGEYIFTDSYRGFNPYSGVEYVFSKGHNIPVWYCDYVGYAEINDDIPANLIYKFLKEARGSHLINCKEQLPTDYCYKNGDLKYEVKFIGDANHSLLQKENIYFKRLFKKPKISIKNKMHRRKKW